MLSLHMGRDPGIGPGGGMPAKMCKKRPAIVQFLNKHFVSSVTRLVIEYLATYYNVNLPKQHQNLAKY